MHLFGTPTDGNCVDGCMHLCTPQTVLDKALAFEVAPDRFEVVKEKKAKDFANMK